MVMCLGQGADATATHSLAPVNPDWFYLLGFYLSGAGSPGWSRTKSKRAVKCLCVRVCVCITGDTSACTVTVNTAAVDLCLVFVHI